MAAYMFEFLQNEIKGVFSWLHSTQINSLQSLEKVILLTVVFHPCLHLPTCAFGGAVIL